MKIVSVSQRDTDNYQFSYQLLFCTCSYGRDGVMSVEHCCYTCLFSLFPLWVICTYVQNENILYHLGVSWTHQGKQLICDRIWFQIKSLDKGYVNFPETENIHLFCLVKHRMFPGAWISEKIQKEALLGWRYIQNSWHRLGIVEPTFFFF